MSPIRLIGNINTLDLSTTLKLKKHTEYWTSSQDNLYVNAQHRSTPELCAHSPAVHTVYTHDCTSRHHEDSIVKYVEDTTIIRRIINNDESSFWEQIREQSTAQCQNQRAEGRQRHTPLST